MKLLKTIIDKKLTKGYKTREASRAIIFDKKNFVPMLFASKYGYHKLAGGGIEKGEDKFQALYREIKEETGCVATISGEVGKIVEHRYKFNLKQISYCYHGKVVKKGKPKFEQDEKDAGFKIVWMTIDEAISKLKNDKPTNYEGKFIKKRDLTFLKEMKKLIIDSEIETQELLNDKELMKAIRQGEKEIKEGKGIDWENFKKELELEV